MPAVTKFQLGAKDEVTYGTPVTVDRFFEFNSWNVKPQRGRIESAGLRAGQRVQRADRWVPLNNGAAGDANFEVLSKGFGFWLKHMLGSVSSSAAVDGKTTHTGSIADLKGDSFTAQVNKPFHPADTDQAFTYEGGKITKWQLANSVNGLLMATLSMDFEDVSTATALATASYPAGTVELFSFVGGTITVGGSQVDMTDFTVACDNMLKVDRQYIRGNSLKKEPTENGFRAVTWSCAADFESLTQYNRYVSDTAAGALATIVATWQAPTLIGVSSKPTIVVTIDEARFDDHTADISGPAALQQQLSGRGMFDGTTSAVTIEYGSADVAP